MIFKQQSWCCHTIQWAVYAHIHICHRKPHTILAVTGWEQYGHSPNTVLNERRVVLTASSHSRRQRLWKGLPHCAFGQASSGTSPAMQYMSAQNVSNACAAHASAETVSHNWYSAKAACTRPIQDPAHVKRASRLDPHRALGQASFSTSPAKQRMPWSGLYSSCTVPCSPCMCNIPQLQCMSRFRSEPVCRVTLAP